MVQGERIQRDMVALICSSRTFLYFMLNFDDAQRCRREYHGQQTTGKDSTGCINISGSGHSSDRRAKCRCCQWKVQGLCSCLTNLIVIVLCGFSRKIDPSSYYFDDQTITGKEPTKQATEGEVMMARGKRKAEGRHWKVTQSELIADTPWGRHSNTRRQVIQAQSRRRRHG